MCNGWYGHVLRKEDSHVLRKALEFEVKGRLKVKGRTGGQNSKKREQKVKGQKRTGG